MAINNARIRILTLLVVDPTLKYTIREISLNTKVNYKLVYQEIIKLEKENIIAIKKIGNSKLCQINLTANPSLCSYIESLRRDNLLRRTASLRVIHSELDKIKSKYFSCIMFGSSVKGKAKKNSDIDLLFIIPDGTNYEKFEWEVQVLFRLLSYKIDVNIITEGSVDELKNKKGLNILNEVIKNHIILYGGEEYYNLIK